VSIPSTFFQHLVNCPDYVRRWIADDAAEMAGSQANDHMRSYRHEQCRGGR
jgi:hypothetical protein